MNQTIHTEPYPPPDNVHLAAVTQRELTFSWDPLASNCPAVTYNINATGCGVCPCKFNNQYIHYMHHCKFK